MDGPSREPPGALDARDSGPPCTTGGSRRLNGRSGSLAVLTAVATSAVLVGLGLAVVPPAPVVGESRPGWKLVLREDFDADTLDAAVWNVQDLPSPRNDELQYYTPAQVRLDAGRLVLGSDRTAMGGRAFTSGAVDTYRKFSFTYGRVEIRAKLPRMGQGMWPALWMLGTGCNPLGPPCPWPAATSAEIDIMEAVGSPTRWYTNLHYGKVAGRSLSSGPTKHAAEDLSAVFHTFAVEWEPGGVVRWYLDDDLVAERTTPGFFDHPMYLMMNTAVGGSWPGPPDRSTPFPQQFEIDSVQVLQRP